LAALLGARDRGNGVPVWLELISYPALLVEYAFGLGASIGRRHDALACVLTAPTPDPLNRWQPAVLQLNCTSLHESYAIKLEGASSRIWPLSDHLYSVTRPWFTKIVPLDALFEREFDRFEILASLVYYDLERGDKERGWSPIGRFARHGRYDTAIAGELIDEARRAVTETRLLADLAASDGDRAEVTLAGFDEHITKALRQVW
jgi:hypothetical protein